MATIKYLFAVLALTIPLAARAQESLVVSYDGYAGFQGPIWATKDLGLFDKYGLKTELVLIAGSPRGMAALMAGSSHFAQGSASAPIPIRLRGGDIAIVAAALNRFPFSVMTQSEIRKPADLIGKKIGILNFGGSNDLAITLAFKEWNIPRQAVTVFASGGAPERLAALSSKAIDATVLSPPETVGGGAHGHEILANLSDLKAAFPQTVITVRRSFSGQEPGHGETLRARLQRSDPRVQDRQGQKARRFTPNASSSKIRKSHRGDL